MTLHIMLDLETWGKRPGNDLRSIGATIFDPFTGDVSIPCETCKGGTTRGNVNDGGDCSDCQNTRMERGYGDTFYIATDNPLITTENDPIVGREQYRKYRRLTRDPETVEWWSKQSEASQAAFANPVDLRDALVQFGRWLMQFDPATAAVTDYPWFNTSQQMPKAPAYSLWSNGPHFDVSILAAAYEAVGLPIPWHYRAPRDFRTIVIDGAGMGYGDFSKYGEPHNALHDAIAQSMTVCEAFKRIRDRNT